MERRVRETIAELLGNFILWGAFLVCLVWLFACEYGPDTMDLSYGRGVGEASAAGFESEAENQAAWINFGWYLKPQEFKLVGHELDATRDAIPVFPTNTPPVVVHDHPEEDSTGDQVGGVITKFDQSDDLTKVALLLVVALVVLLAAMAAAVWLVIKKTNGKSTAASS